MLTTKHLLSFCHHLEQSSIYSLNKYYYGVLTRAKLCCRRCPGAYPANSQTRGHSSGSDRNQTAKLPQSTGVPNRKTETEHPAAAEQPESECRRGRRGPGSTPRAPEPCGPAPRPPRGATAKAPGPWRWGPAKERRARPGNSQAHGGLTLLLVPCPLESRPRANLPAAPRPPPRAPGSSRGAAAASPTRGWGRRVSRTLKASQQPSSPTCCPEAVVH